jgi:hypothetical protein
MPSPFPGMDPYIERFRWSDFHHSLISSIRDSLVPSLRPRYFVVAEDRVYVERDPDGREVYIRPDLLVTPSEAGPHERGGVAVLPTPDTVDVVLPIPERVIEHYLTIRDTETRDVVTIIEMLSPANKWLGSKGRMEYLGKRDTVLLSATHLVEIDLLRGGQRLPTVRPLPVADFYTIVSPSIQRPHATAYCTTIRQPLPTIAVPLKHGDKDVPLDLQAAFTAAYDSSDYDYSLDYSAHIEPSLSESDAAWARDVLQSHGPR